MHPSKQFELMMTKLEQTFGQKVARRTYLVLTRIVQWLAEHGHGDVTLSARDHCFGQKIRGDTIFTVENEEK